MTENNRFVDNGFEAIEDQSFMDNLTQKTYYVDYFDEIIELCNNLWKQTKRFEKHNKDLMDENEQLKQELKDYHNAFDCSQCRYQNYDWFDDGDEFEVCDKGNNELQMNNHSCRDWEEL